MDGNRCAKCGYSIFRQSTMTVDGKLLCLGCVETAHKLNLLPLYAGLGWAVAIALWGWKAVWIPAAACGVFLLLCALVVGAVCLFTLNEEPK